MYQFSKMWVSLSYHKYPQEWSVCRCYPTFTLYLIWPTSIDRISVKEMDTLIRSQYLQIWLSS